MKIKEYTLLFAFFALTNVTAIARTVEERTTRHNERIKDGIESGSLTRKEASRLNKTQERIESLEDKYSSDGKLNRKEERKLRKLQAKQSQKIYKEKNDWQKAK